MVLRSDRLLDDLAAQKASARAQLGLVSLQKEGVEATAVFHRAQGSSRNAEAETLAESVGNQSDMAQVRQELALRLVVCVADIVARLDALAAQFAHTGHDTPAFSIPMERYLDNARPAFQQVSIGKLRFYSHIIFKTNNTNTNFIKFIWFKLFSNGSISVKISSNISWQ